MQVQQQPIENNNRPQRSQFITAELLGRDGMDSEVAGTPNYTPNNLHVVGRPINSLLPGAILNLNLFGSVQSNGSS